MNTRTWILICILIAVSGAYKVNEENIKHNDYVNWLYSFRTVCVPRSGQDIQRDLDTWGNYGRCDLILIPSGNYAIEKSLSIDLSNKRKGVNVELRDISLIVSGEDGVNRTSLTNNYSGSVFTVIDNNAEEKK